MDLNGGIREAACTSLNSKLEKQPKERSQPTIYRVHRHLRDVNCSAYEPAVISIGPYHRGKDHLKMMEDHNGKDHLKMMERKDHLKMMEDHKLQTLQLFVERQGIDIMELVDVLGGEASKARKCYANQDFDLSESEFIEMLVLDGCFIIQFARRCVGWEKEADPIFQSEWMTWSLLRDLTLFENQVPFFILLKLFNVIYPDSTYFDLVHLLSYLFKNLYPGIKPSAEEVKSRSSEIARQGSQEIMHILDLIHRNWLPHGSQKSEEEKSDNIKRKGPESQESEEGFCFHCHAAFKICLQCCSKKKSEFELIYCATRLTEANVKFEMKEAATLFDIEFKDGTMVMPRLCIDDMTECLFRNLIAYETYFKKSPDNPVTHYYRLLDSLINSSQDVEILSQNRIITHLQGDDEVVANMVNRLGDLVVSDILSNFKYAKLYEAVNDHCRKRKNRWMAKLRRDYFNSPWAIISFLAALVLLGLTIAQTYFAI